MTRHEAHRKKVLMVLRLQPRSIAREYSRRLSEWAWQDVHCMCADSLEGAAQDQHDLCHEQNPVGVNAESDIRSANCMVRASAWMQVATEAFFTIFELGCSWKNVREDKWRG